MAKRVYACKNRSVAKDLFEKKSSGGNVNLPQPRSGSDFRFASVAQSMARWEDGSVLESSAAQIQQLNPSTKSYQSTSVVDGTALKQITVYNSSPYDIAANDVVKVEYKGGYWWVTDLATQPESQTGDVVYATNNATFTTSASPADITCTVATGSPTLSVSSSVTIENIGMFEAATTGQRIIGVYSAGKYRMVNVECPAT